jgi:hypothetical protein
VEGHAAVFFEDHELGRGRIDIWCVEEDFHCGRTTIKEAQRSDCHRAMVKGAEKLGGPLSALKRGQTR